MSKTSASSLQKTISKMLRHKHTLIANRDEPGAGVRMSKRKPYELAHSAVERCSGARMSRSR